MLFLLLRIKGFRELCSRGERERQKGIAMKWGSRKFCMRKNREIEREREREKRVLRKMEGLRRIYTTFGYKVLDVHRKRGRDEWGELPIGR